MQRPSARRTSLLSPEPLRAPVSGGVAPIDRDGGTGEVPVVTVVEGRRPSPLAGFKDGRPNNRRFMSSKSRTCEPWVKTGASLVCRSRAFRDPQHAGLRTRSVALKRASRVCVKV